MAIWFIDGFDHYNIDTFGQPSTATTYADILRKWTSQQSSGGTKLISPLYARSLPGMGFKTYNSDSNLYKVRPAGSTTNLICGASFLFQNNPSTEILFSARETSTDQCSLRGDNAGHLTVTRNGTVLATSANTISLNVWYWIEFKCTISSAAGTYHVKVDGTDWIAAATGKNTAATANINYTTVGLGGANINTFIDDFYAGDGASDFIGYQKVVTLRPCAAGTTTQFTPNFGNNFGNVNEITPDGDFSFNQSVTANHIDTFSFPDIPFAAGTISAIQHVIYAKQDAGAVRVIAPVQYSGGTAYVGTSRTLSTSYNYYTEVKELNPVDSAAFDIADVNGAEFGYKLIS